MTEQSSPLERSLTLTVSLAGVDADVAKRLKQLSKTARIDGFRPGKVPASMLRNMYGDQVMRDALSDAAQNTFQNAVREQSLRVVGTPMFESVESAPESGQYAFKATFEVFPEVVPGDISNAAIERPLVTVTDADVDRTIDILRKQRTRWVSVARDAAAGDRVLMDFKGFKDDVPFEGGTGEKQHCVLGSGQYLADFENALLGAKAGDTRNFDMTFPADYQAPGLAGQTVRFEVFVHDVQMPVLPELDAEFAQSLGIESGDTALMRAEIQGNLEREAKKRIQGRLKDQVMKALVEATELAVPKALIGFEIQRLRQNAAQDWKARTGQDMNGMQLPDSLFEEQAKRRVSVGLVLSELVQREKLEAAPEQVRALLVEQAESYEQPDEMVRWYYEDPERLREVESVVLEDNVVTWALSRAKVSDKPIAFQDLIGGAA